MFTKTLQWKFIKSRNKNNLAILKNKFTCLVAATSILVGILYIAPQILIWGNLSNLGKPYVAVQMNIRSDEANGGLAMYREIYEGHLVPDDLFLDINAPTPFLGFELPSLIMGFFIFLFKGNINQAYLASHFVIPPLIFLLFFFLGWVLTKDKLWSFFLALIGVFTPIFQNIPYMFKNLDNFLNVAVKNFYPLVQTPLDRLFLDKTPDQMLTYPVYILALAFLVIFWRKPTIKNGVAAGVLIGIMAYTYFHYWVYLTIIAGLIFAFSAITFKKHLQRFKAASFLIGILLLVLFPYLINIFAFNTLPHSEEISQRIGITVGRYFHFLSPFPIVFDYVFYLMMAAFVYFVFYKSDKNLAVLYWILLGGMFIVWNVQLVIGYVPQPDHWWRAVAPAIFVIMFHSLYKLSEKFQHKKAIAVALIVLSFLLLTKKIVNAFIFIDPPQKFLDSYTFNPHIVASWDWINANLEKEPKMVSSSFITSLYLVAQTGVRSYLATGFNSVATNEFLEERFLKTYKVFDISEDMLRRITKRCPNCESSDLESWANVSKPMKHLRMSEERISGLLKKYENMPQVNWKELGADYVYYGPWEKQLSKINLILEKELITIYKNPEVEIYKIKK